MPKQIQIHIRHEIRSRAGKLLRASPWKPTHSLLKQFAQVLTAQAANAAQTIKDTGGTDRSISAAATNLLAAASAGTTTYGPVIGTGTDPVAMTDYKLQTQVTTNITYGTVTVTVENPSANVWRVVISRPFTNLTGSTLNLTEVALYTYMGASYYGCMDRTLYSLSIPNGASRTITYRITITL